MTDETTPQPMWRVTYTYRGHRELDLTATFYLRAPDAITAIQESRAAVKTMFTERAQEVISLRAVEAD